MGRMGLLGRMAGGEPGACHAFAQAALLEELLFEAGELAVQQIVGLVDQADQDIGHHLGWPGLDELGLGIGEQIAVAAMGRDKPGK